MKSFDRRRPRLLAYVGRWGRARRWLPTRARSIIDVGCATGYGTAALASRQPDGHWTAGLERDTGLVWGAGERYPWLPMLCGDAAAIPVRDGALDAVTMLDVLEHLPNPAAALAEARRVLRPGGCLLISVPHAGLFAALDANNIYSGFRRRWRSLPPLEPYDAADSGHHRHFALDELRQLLGPGYAVDRVAYTGVGVAELLHLVVLLLFRIVFYWHAGYVALRFLLHFNTYLVEDCLPCGTLAYHLTVRARVV